MVKQSTINTFVMFDVTLQRCLIITPITIMYLGAGPTAYPNHLLSGDVSYLTAESKLKTPGHKHGVFKGSST